MNLDKLQFNVRYNTIIIFCIIIIFIIYGLIIFINDFNDGKCDNGKRDCTYDPECNPNDMDCSNIGEENDIKYD